MNVQLNVVVPFLVRRATGENTREEGASVELGIENVEATIPELDEKPGRVLEIYEYRS